MDEGSDGRGRVGAERGEDVQGGEANLAVLLGFEHVDQGGQSGDLAAVGASRRSITALRRVSTLSERKGGVVLSLSRKHEAHEQNQGGPQMPKGPRRGKAWREISRWNIRR